MIQKPHTLFKRYDVSEIFFIDMLSKLDQPLLIVSTGKIKLPDMKLGDNSVCKSVQLLCPLLEFTLTQPPGIVPG